MQDTARLVTGVPPSASYEFEDEISRLGTVENVLRNDAYNIITSCIDLSECGLVWFTLDTAARTTEFTGPRRLIDAIVAHVSDIPDISIEDVTAP